MMKRLTAAVLITSALFAASASASAAGLDAPEAEAAPVHDAQIYAVLKNIDTRLAELNLKLSTPQVQGCSDGEHVYSPGFVVKKDVFSLVCLNENGQYRWKTF